jgi:hypothetical protein
MVPNVGIGTTSPGAPLDVKGEIRMSGATSGYTGFKPAAAAGGTVWELPVVDGSNGQVLTTNGTGILSWSSAGGGGEINTASNVGAAGVGVFKQKTGVNLELKNINVGSNKLSVTDDTVNNELDLDVNEANLTLGNLGGTLGVSKGGTGSTTALSGNKMMVSSGATIVENANVIAINSPLRSDANGLPSTGAIGLGGTDVTGTLTVDKGGTGIASYTAGDLLYASGATTLAKLPKGTDGQVLSLASGAPSWSTASYPASTTANQLMYSSANNVVGGLTTANNAVLTTNGSGVPAWAPLANDTFSQYALLAGRAGGQTLNGGTALSENLTLDSTTNVTKGYVLIAPTGGNVGIGTSAPGAPLDVKGAIRMSGATSGYTGFKPAAAAGGTVWELPAADGTNGQVLSTNGSGVLNWSSAGGGGSVTNVSSANADIGVATGASTPVLTLNSGTAGGVGDANKIAKLSAGGLLATAMIPDLDTAKLTAGTLPIARGGTNSTTALNNNRVMASSGGAIVEAAAITASRALVSDVNGIPTHSAVTSTELGYLSGVTSAVQTQIDGKAASAGWTNYSVIGVNGTGNLSAIAGATGNTMLQWTASGASWSTASYPASTTANQLIYSSANNVVGGLATANNAVLTTNGSGVPAWAPLANDTYSQYALLAGRAGGQTLSGGNAASENLTLDSTTNVTKGNVLIVPTGGNVGIGTSSPGSQLDVLFPGNGFPSSSLASFRTGSGTASNISIRAYSDNWGGDLSFNRTWNGSNDNRSNTGYPSFSINGNPMNNRMDFNYAPAAANPITWSTGLTMLATGNVGIGTTSPGAPLDVKGAIRMSGATSGFTGFKPAAAAGGTVWELPAADGTNGQVLSTNGSGVLNWSSAGGGGTVTNVSSANADIGVATGASTPVLTLNSGTTGGVGDANKIAKLSAGGLLATAMIPDLDTGKLTAGTLPIARGGTNSTTALNNNRVMVSSGGAIVEAAAITASRALVSDVNGIPTHSAVTSTELGYLSGVTSAVQTQINGKASSSSWTNYSVIGVNGTGNLSAIAGATGNTMLQWTASGATWSTASYPASTTANQLMYSSANNVVGGLATANNAVLTTNGSGVPAWAPLANDTYSQYALLAGRAGGQTLSGGNAASENLTLDSTTNGTKGNVLIAPTGGSVGIGTAAPSAPLDIYGANLIIGGDTADGTLRTNATAKTGMITTPHYTNAEEKISVMGTFSGPAATTLYLGGGSGTFNAATQVEFWTAANTTTLSGSVRMKIDNSGKVGIGTTSPGAPLDVKGEIRMTGATSGYTGFKPAAAAGGTVWELPSADGANGQMLTTSGAGVLSWTTPPGAGGGEANTASNVGTAGVGVFKQKTGIDLEFKKINIGSSKLSVTDDTGNSELDLDVVEANLTLNNIGGTLGVSKGGTGSTTALLNNKIMISSGGNIVENANVMSVSSPMRTDVNGNPTTGAIALGGAEVSGTLPATKGGTGLASFAVGDIFYASSTTAISPLTAGTNGHVLTLAGGVPTWAAGGGGGGTPGGSTTQLQYNDAGAFAGDAGMTYDAANDALTVNGSLVLGATAGLAAPTNGFVAGSSGYVQFNSSGDFGGSTNLFWDNTNFRLGVNNATPAVDLHIGSASRTAGAAVASFQTATGTCTMTPATSGTGIACSSDERLKKNIENVAGEFALGRILELQAVTYEFKKDPTNQRHTGYIAQKLKVVAPEFVRLNEDGYYQIYYDGLIPWITEAIKELYEKIAKNSAATDQKIDNLEKENLSLKQENAAIKQYLCAKDPGAALCQ